MTKTGIDAISFYVPKLYLPIQDLAEYRNIPFEKLSKGLGLQKMAIPDVDEDASSFAANALISLFSDNNIDPKTVGRIYLGTESAVDGSKPSITYAMDALEQKLASEFGERSLQNCDVVDMTFACIGAVDAFQNCYDWVRLNPTKKAIVVASDVSKYELNSTGEYTQGAGAVAVLISENPSILAIDTTFGVATKSEGDFFKPRRFYTKSTLLNDISKSLGSSSDEVLKNAKTDFWKDPNQLVEVFKEEPVFDGQFSNQCYEDRITEALAHFNEQKETNFLADWEHIVFHLPYAYHGRRIAFSNWLQWIKNNNKFSELEAEVTADISDKKTWKREAVKSNLYQDFVREKISYGEKASSEIGNMYTASIFMSLLSLLSFSNDNNIQLATKKIGFIAYGSGSKSKVFEGTIQENWQEKIDTINLFSTLENRQAIDISTYEDIHNTIISEPISDEGVRRTSINKEGVLKGLRHYN